jgi:uncharacterized membrane protein
MNQLSNDLKSFNPELDLDEIPAQLVKNIESIAQIQNQHEQPDNFHLKLLDRIATFCTKPAFLYTLLAFFLVWWVSSKLHRSGLIPWDIPDYRLQDQFLDTVALVISTAILIRQTRQEQVADRQSHLMLQLDLLTEQKIAKIIGLLEELRADLPNVIDRIDLEAESMKQSTDPKMVINIIQENLQPLDKPAEPEPETEPEQSEPELESTTDRADAEN